MKTLTIANFLAKAQKVLPTEFNFVSRGACDYVKVAIDQIGSSDKKEVLELRLAFKKKCQFLLSLAKARGFTPSASIGPFNFVNFLIR
jgi:hypothetical protein